MRIAYLAAGAAGMYCGACLHDNTLAAALLAAGEDVLLVPTYTPLRTDEASVSLDRVYFGGAKVYLAQRWALFRRRFAPLDGLLNSRLVTRWLGRMRVSVDARRLGPLTVSILKGEEGPLRQELTELVDWLAADVRPDVVHLSNALLAGWAGPIRRRLSVPVVSSLAGEDVFLELLPPPHYDEARRLLTERCRDVTACVAYNRYYADFMIDYAGLDAERVEVIPLGLNLTGYGPRPPRAPGAPPTLGYFARIHPDKGLHLLVEAFCRLAEDERLAGLRLLAGGYLAPDQRHYLDEQRRRLRDCGLEDRFTYAGELDRAGKIALLQSMDVMCLPTVYRESKGLPALEALAAGVPVVLPAHGGFPELIADTGGGELFKPADTAALAEVLCPLLLDTARAAELGRRGQEAIRQRYSAEVMAARTRELYRRLCGAAAGTPGAAAVQPLGH
jgi:glycosyltransferase involved in cell wall biosynthesis